MLELIALQSLEEIIWMTMPIFYVAGMVMVFAMPIVIFLFWKKWLPKPARTLFWAARRKTPPLILCHDSGRGELTTIRERRGEGIVVTEQNRYKILPRWMPKIPFSAMLGLQQTTQPQLTEETEEGDPAPTVEGQPATSQQPAQPQSNEVDLHKVFNIKLLKDNFILDYGDWVVKRSSLIGLDMPMWFGYTGKLCLLNPEALALYEAGEMMIRTPDAPNGVMFNPNNVQDKNLKDALEPLLLLDPRKIQQIIYDGFDQSQIAGVVADTEDIVRLGQGGLSSKMKLILGIIVIAGLAVAAIFFLPQLLKGQQQGQSPPTSSFILAIRTLLRL